MYDLNILCGLKLFQLFARKLKKFLGLKGKGNGVETTQQLVAYGNVWKNRHKVALSGNWCLWLGPRHVPPAQVGIAADSTSVSDPVSVLHQTADNRHQRGRPPTWTRFMACDWVPVIRRHSPAPRAVAIECRCINQIHLPTVFTRQANLPDCQIAWQ